MNANSDYYAVLGVLPNAESVVIVAAYRALASLYHPDRWKGDVDGATRRMAEINVAYGVLSDSAKRKAYDATRSASHSTFGDSEDENDAAFDSALTEQEVRWQVAVEIFPDLVDIRKRLTRTAHRLAFAFVTVLLETKRFNERKHIADAMETSFLEQYFGTDKKIVVFVKQLVNAGCRDAVKAVNRYVNILGSDVPAERIIDKVLDDCNLNLPYVLAVAVFIEASGDPNSEHAFNAAWTLAFRLKYSPDFNGSTVELRRNHKLLHEFPTKRDFVLWFIDNPR
jgi:curved DNA-binding protein CbpA